MDSLLRITSIDVLDPEKSYAVDKHMANRSVLIQFEPKITPERERECVCEGERERGGGGKGGGKRQRGGGGGQ